MLNLISLDARVRERMLKEIEQDIAAGSLYDCPRLNPRGKSMYPDLLREAATNYDDEWLADQLRKNVCMEDTEPRRKPTGGVTYARVPITAPVTLAEGEFNRYYLRGLCLLAIELGTPELVIYRAKSVAQPRQESVAMIGRLINANALLVDLRLHPGVETALRLPPGPNSGLSARLP